jgi:hypothetical protein
MKVPFILFRWFTAAVFVGLTGTGCSKKQTPTATKETTAVTPPAPKTKKIKVATPKVIVVNDQVAQRTVDGRLYYDLNGKRYWKNFKDGKYYIFNKAMYNNPEFKP